MEPTESVPQSEVSLPYLRRSLDIATKAAEHGASASGSRPAESNGKGKEREGDSSAAAAADGGVAAQPYFKSARWNAMLHRDTLSVKIIADSYKLEFPTSDTELDGDWWVALHARVPRAKASESEKNAESEQEAKGGGEGTEEEAAGAEAQEDEAEGDKAEGKSGSGKDKEGEGGAGYEPDIDAWHAFEEKFVLNNAWMRGWSRDEVAGKNKVFREWVGDEEFPAAE